MISTANVFVTFYCWWHGRLHLRGAGILLERASRYISELRDYPLFVEGIGFVHVDFSDVSGMAWINYSLGESGHEDGLLICLKKLISSPKCIWEVGANGGYFAAQILKAFPDFEHLYLFEPNPSMHRMLECVTKARSGIFLCPFALGDFNGKSMISFEPGNSSLASFRGAASGLHVEVEVRTGDAFLSKSPDAISEVIIIDVEGAENSVLIGMHDLLKTRRPIVVFEQIFFDPSTLDALMPEGYTRFTIDDKSGELIAGFHLNLGHNGIFIPN